MLPYIVESMMGASIYSREHDGCFHIIIVESRYSKCIFLFEFHIWQSWVETERYSVTYFDYVTMFEM